MLHVKRNDLQSSMRLNADDVAEPTLRERFETYWQFCRRHYPRMAVVFCCVMALSLIYLFTATPMYTGVADLIIDTRHSQILQQQSPVSDQSQGLVDSSMIDSQVEVLKSKNVALGVVRDLHLADDAEFMAPSSALLAAITSRLDRLFGGGGPASHDELEEMAVARLQNNLTIKRVGTTYVIEISFKASSPTRAATIANAVADAYVADSLEAKYQMSRRAGKWLQDRLTELRTQAKDADRAVVDFKARNNIIETNGRLVNEQQIADLNSSLAAAKGLAADSKARMERISSILSDKQGGAVLDAAATVTDSLHNDVITRLRSQYLDLSAREAEWSAKYGVNHLAAVNLRSQMAEIRHSIQDELRRIAETYKSDYVIAKSRVDAVEADLSATIQQSNQTNQAQITLRDLDSTAQSYRALADNFLQLFMQSVQQQSFPITESRLITSASPPGRKSSPRTSIVLGVGFVLGCLLATAAALVKDLMDRVFRTGTQIEQRLQTTCLAMVPYLKFDALLPPGLAFEQREPRTFDFHSTVAGQILREPFSRYAEAMRSIKVAHELRNNERAGKVLGITSSLPHEGKTTIAASVALATAASGARRVVLVDCDLRNPSLTRMLARNSEEGLLEVVAGKRSFRDVIWEDKESGLSFLPAVVKSKLPYTSEMLSSNAMRELFEALGREFDTIVVDLPPVAPIVDVRTTSSFVDAYVYVIEWGATRFNMVERALSDVPEVYNKLLGVVLNKANLAVVSRYEAVQGSYYHNRYYGNYGYNQ